MSECRLLIIVFASMLLGFCIRELIGLLRIMRYVTKSKRRGYGCLRYVPTEHKELRDGTLSRFCQRCGKPAGVHLKFYWREVASGNIRWGKHQ